jgi:hypothetical protein
MMLVMAALSLLVMGAYAQLEGIMPDGNSYYESQAGSSMDQMPIADQSFSHGGHYYDWMSPGGYYSYWYYPSTYYYWSYPTTTYYWYTTPVTYYYTTPVVYSYRWDYGPWYPYGTTTYYYSSSYSYKGGINFLSI